MRRGVGLVLGALAILIGLLLWRRGGDGGAKPADPPAASKAESAGGATAAEEHPDRSVPTRPRAAPPPTRRDLPGGAEAHVEAPSAGTAPPADVPQSKGWLQDELRLEPEDGVPEEAMVEYYNVEMLLKGADYEEALRVSLAALEKYPTSFFLHSAAVKALCGSGEIEKARALIDGAGFGKTRKEQLKLHCEVHGGVL